LGIDNLIVAEPEEPTPRKDADDLIDGTDRSDSIKAFAGDDLIFGRLDNDRIYEGDGNNKPGSGDDNLVGQGGNDVIRGEDGNDLLFGDASDSDNSDTTLLARLRVGIEHTIRCFKIFHIFSSRYGNRRRRFGLRFNLIAGILNYELNLIA
jgi:Ca2+-binding RTX toxin-like protein